jgi:hypothetical protein
MKTAGEAVRRSAEEVRHITKHGGAQAGVNYVKEKAVSHINQYSSDIILAAVFDFPKRIGSEVLKLHESKNSGSDKGQRQDAAGNSVSSATESSSSTASSISSSVSKAASSIGSSISSAANIIKTTVRNTLNKLFRK